MLRQESAEYALICVVGGIISMIGDLAASAIKRNHEIKDYGKLIPGHGGILDRFDSVIFTAPVIYYPGSCTDRNHDNERVSNEKNSNIRFNRFDRNPDT